MRNCLVIGYGWLGEPLSLELQSRGYEVFATTSDLSKSKTISTLGMHPFLLKKESGVLSFESVPTHHFDSVIVTLPPFEEAVYSMENLLSKLSYSQLIFTSSTGVYLDTNEVLSEEAPVDSNHKVYQMEEIVRNLAPDSYVILRLAGHIGPNRHPLRYFLAKNRMISKGKAPVNLIHQSDIIQVILVCMVHQTRKEIFNVCWPEHPTKEDYYGNLARAFAGVNLVFDLDDFGKTIDGSKITRDLSFRYHFSIRDISLLDLKKDNI